MLWFAPLHGIANRLFRQVYFKHFTAFDALMSPFILSMDPANTKASYFKDLVPIEAEGTRPRMVPQILSNNADDFLASGQLLAEQGYDELNWNLGCPFPMVAKKKRGSGLLPYPEEIDAFLNDVCKKTPLPISVKLRLGRFHKEEIEPVIPILNRYPLVSITLHPRIGKQLYKGEADIDAFDEAASRIKHRLIYNGDIFSVSFFIKLQNRFPSIREWMLGRGALRYPFLAEEIKGIAYNGSRLERLRLYHDELFAAYEDYLFGPAHLLDKMKEQWTFLKCSFPEHKKEIHHILRSRQVNDYKHWVHKILP